MPETYLILDCPFLAYRANAAMSDLMHEDDPTSVVFGLMRDLVAWKELFRTDKVVFCFDRGMNRRLEICPEYKANRRYCDETEQERMARERFREQVRRLMEEDLFRLGYRNVLWEEGLEADDIIASVVFSSLGEGDEAIIVASDADLYQLIAPNVSMFDPVRNKRKMHQWFCSEYGIQPSQWADVKAIAGCSGDNVKGVRGVGEKSAIAFLLGKMNPEHQRHRSIMENKDVWKRNLKLVQLPFRGTPVYELREDRVTQERWDKFCKSYGMRSLRGLYPGR